jgi:hypothetical protein
MPEGNNTHVNFYTIPMSRKKLQNTLKGLKRFKCTVLLNRHVSFAVKYTEIVQLQNIKDNCMEA